MQAAGADQVDVRPIGQRVDDIERVGDHRQRHVDRQKLGERQHGRARIEENCLVGPDPSRRDSCDGFFFLAANPLPLVERHIAADFLGQARAAVAAQQFTAFFQDLEVLAHGLIGHPQRLGGLGRAQGSRLGEELQNPALTFDGEHGIGFFFIFLGKFGKFA